MASSEKRPQPAPPRGPALGQRVAPRHFPAPPSPQAQGRPLGVCQVNAEAARLVRAPGPAGGEDAARPVSTPALCFRGPLARGNLGTEEQRGRRDGLSSGEGRVPTAGSLGHCCSPPQACQATVLPKDTRPERKGRVCQVPPQLCSGLP